MPRASRETAMHPTAGPSWLGDNNTHSIPRQTAARTTQRPHECPDCEKAFSTGGHLARHQRIHTGEMNYACPFPGCQTRCSRKDNMRQHYRLHFDFRSPEELQRAGPEKRRRKTRVKRIETPDIPPDTSGPRGISPHLFEVHPPPRDTVHISAPDSRQDHLIQTSVPAVPFHLSVLGHVSPQLAFASAADAASSTTGWDALYHHHDTVTSQIMDSPTRPRRRNTTVTTSPPDLRYSTSSSSSLSSEGSILSAHSSQYSAVSDGLIHCRSEYSTSPYLPATRNGYHNAQSPYSNTHSPYSSPVPHMHWSPPHDNAQHGYGVHLEQNDVPPEILIHAPPFMHVPRIPYYYDEEISRPCHERGQPGVLPSYAPSYERYVPG